MQYDVLLFSSHILRIILKIILSVRTYTTLSRYQSLQCYAIRYHVIKVSNAAKYVITLSKSPMWCNILAY